MHVLSVHPGAPHHVKFSADSLFHSPQHPSVGSKHRRQSAVAGDVSALLLQEESMVASRSSVTEEHGSDNRVAGTSDRNGQREEEAEEIETLDEPSYARNNTSHHAAVSTSDPVTHNQHNRSQNASILSDFSLNNISLMSDHPGINTSAYGHAHTPYTANYNHNHNQNRATPSTAGVYSTYPSAYDNNHNANISTTNASVREFSNISDGGYHEGYWRAKYTRSSKQ